MFTKCPAESWQEIRNELWKRFSVLLPEKNTDKEIVQRDRDLAELDNLIAGSAWNLWSHWQPTAAENIIRFWNDSHGGKAVLILDGLSLRELPLLLKIAEQFTVKETGLWQTELPPITTKFAQAVGFSQRSDLEKNGSSKKLPDAWTASCDLPFADCIKMIPPQPKVLFWHHYPDSQIHENTPEKLAKDTVSKLLSNDFSRFLETLTASRTLLITSDHGYAAPNFYLDLPKEQGETMQKIFKGQRYCQNTDAKLPFIPPLEMTIGNHRFVLGRRKWKLPGGYPALQHGGLSLLEMFVPYIVLNEK
jgi:hypothetical protein